jgi:membrane-associated phospholipid phosphatase
MTVFLFLSWTLSAQENPATGRYSRPDSTYRRELHARWAIPVAACVTYGMMARFNEQSFRLDRSVGERVNRSIHRRYTVDDYLQYAPAVVAYGLDFVPGVTSEHNFRDRTLLFATSYLIAGVAVGAMKTGISVWRPDGSGDNSFPSGHTTVAFAGAHLLFKEYRHQSPWIGVGGYAAATTTGVLRVINRKHWVSDVVTGASIGILSVEAAYRLLPVWHRLLGIREDEGRRMTIVPAVGAHRLEIGWVYVF